MIKNIILIFISCIGFVNWSYSQKTIDKNFLQNEVPKEQVYIHVNTTLLLSGEKLLYKFYCVNSGSNKLSNLSEIGWVTLVNSDREEVFQHKLDLDNGQAYSDFFIPSDLPSGAYKILGYTSWMLNAKGNYFEQDIHILNPYQKSNKGLILNDSIEATIQKVKTQTSNEFSLDLNKNSFSKREEVILSIDNNNEVRGDFSISVRRIDDFDKPKRVKSTNFSEIYNRNAWDFSDTLILPEVRGSFYRGRIRGGNKETFQSNNLIVSFAGEKNHVNIVSVDDTGEFNFTVNNGSSVDEVLFQLLGYNKDDFSVGLYKDNYPDFSKLNFGKQPTIQKNLKDYILEKSINNQIENAFSITKADQVLIPEDKAYFFDGELIKYNLDDYKRFKEVSETFVEIIKSGRVEKNKDETYSIFVRNENFNGQFTQPALLIVDGVVVQDHSKLISFGAERIQTIGLLTRKTFYGPETFQGIVTIETKEGDFPEELRGSYMKSAKIITSQSRKQYYSPDYKNEDLDRIPDYRYQLWWNPNASFKTKNSVNFFTSDLSGKFEIELEGFTKDGEPISIRKVFSVD
ncbi:MAG: hypothetical protein R6V36_01005 [Psychroflexus sp.]